MISDPWRKSDSEKAKRCLITAFTMVPVDQRGPANASRDVQGVLHSLARPLSISLQDISVVSPNDKLVKAIRKAAHIPGRANGVRFTRTRLDDTYIEDAYIYSLKPRWAKEMFTN